MEKLSEEAVELMSKLKEAVQKEGAICVISIGKGKYLSQAMHGTAKDIIALLCCGVDQISEKTGEPAISILMRMMEVMFDVKGDKE